MFVKIVLIPCVFLASKTQVTVFYVRKDTFQWVGNVKSKLVNVSILMVQSVILRDVLLATLKRVVSFLLTRNQLKQLTGVNGVL